MTTQDIATAMQRVQSVMQRRPELGLKDDAPATLRWEGGLRLVSSHSCGVEVASDMPVEIGGTGDQPSPGWLLRASLSSCTATVVLMIAAEEGIALTELGARASSRSDVRGVLGMSEPDGRPVDAGTRDLQLEVRVRAAGVPAQRLRALVQAACRRSPVLLTLQRGTPVEVRIDAGTDD